MGDSFHSIIPSLFVVRYGSQENHPRPLPRRHWGRPSRPSQGQTTSSFTALLSAMPAWGMRQSMRSGPWLLDWIGPRVLHPMQSRLHEWKMCVGYSPSSRFATLLSSVSAWGMRQCMRSGPWNLDWIGPQLLHPMQSRLHEWKMSRRCLMHSYAAWLKIFARCSNKQWTLDPLKLCLNTREASEIRVIVIK